MTKNADSSGIPPLTTRPKLKILLGGGGRIIKYEGIYEFYYVTRFIIVVLYITEGKYVGRRDRNNCNFPRKTNISSRKIRGGFINKRCRAIFYSVFEFNFFKSSILNYTGYHHKIESLSRTGLSPKL